MNPKVFISHASEDKERFVMGFATRLRAAGIDAWLDRWEMLPGDSLVDKIFEEGIKDAQAVIVVLSKYSITKPWVREELNAGVVRRIEGISRLIPIILDIDDSEVPQSLRSTLWIRIEDFDNYGPQFDRSIVGNVATEIVNYKRQDSKSIADAIGESLMVVNHILDIFERNGLLTVLREIGSNSVHFYNVSPELKRRLEAPRIE